MRRILTLALTATAVAVPAVSMAAAPDATAKPPPSTLKWAPCPADVAQAVPLECSTLDVPLDYRKPDGRQIEIAISRLASKEPSQRRGILLTNPGGPGGSGLSHIGVLATTGVPQAVLDAYDLIGFDPRGVGRSTPVSCSLTPAQQAVGAFPTYANSPADVVREAKFARTVAKQCATSPSASTLPHITTANTARDMDRIRIALGEEKASYFGASYGSYLGAVYTTLFPTTTDRVLLDSVTGSKGYGYEQMRMFARGMQDRFPDFAKWAAAHPSYGLGSTPQQVTAKYYELARRMDKRPIHGVSGTFFRGITFEKLYGDAWFPALAAIWKALDNNQPPPPPAEGGDFDNVLAARLHVICGDSRWPERIREYQRNVAIDRVKYPMLGASAAGIGPCAFWPDTRVEPPVKISDRGPSNVLLVQYERDPGTALAGARDMRRAFGQRTKLVTVDGGGHGVYPWSRNTCGNDAVTKFLLTGERPAKDLACAPNPK